MSSTCWSKRKLPNVGLSATNENDSVRISRLATFVEVTTRPYQSEPLGMLVSFIHSARICGAAFGRATRGVGQGFGDRRTALAATKVPVVDSEHADATNSTAAAIKVRTKSIAREQSPYTMKFGCVNARPAPSVLYDWSMAVISLWLSGGIMIDAWHHFHSTVETFFEPAHGLLYAGLLASYVFTAIAVAVYRRQGFPLRYALPAGYELTVAGLIVTLIGGILDMIKHTLFGFEQGFDALLSPTHLLVGAGMFLIITGPIRSTLDRKLPPCTLIGQLPMILALASMMELVHWGTQFIFLTGAERINAPLPAAGSAHDTLTLIALQYYKQGIGLVAVILQSILIAGFGLFALRRIALAPGALVILFVVGNAFVAGAHSNTPGQLWGVILASVAAGICGECFRLGPSVDSGGRWNGFAFSVPAIYWATLLSVLSFTMGGLWWSPDVISGSVVFAGLTGLFMNAIASPYAFKPGVAGDG
jgi:hypothetical protein